MRHCIRCDGWKDESEFNIRDSKRELLQYVCRDCQKNRAETAMQITRIGSKKSTTMHGLLQKKMQFTLSSSIYFKTHVVIVEKPILQF